MSPQPIPTELDMRRAGVAWVTGMLPILRSKSVILTLEGEMGAGKTVFVKGVAEGLGVTAVVSSPSYTIIKEYTGSHGRLVHLDCWRTPTLSPEDIHLEEYLVAGTVLAVEWPEPLISFLRGTGVPLTKYKIVTSGDDRELQEVAV